MIKTMMKINRKPKEMFNTTHIKDHPYGEVSRSFIDQLEHTWHLLDSYGNMHSITYNQDMVNPTILAGWTKLRDFYRKSSSDHDPFWTVSEPKAYPKWHSLYHQIPNLVTFKVLLNEYKVNCSSLDVSSTMYSFMKATRFTHLNLEGITEWIVYNHWRKSTKIGYG
ncbi:hypothetical protein HKD37_10G028257 [Glycine soja]|nr:hypothetical protein GmHk_10G028564 [Glycine max]